MEMPLSQQQALRAANWLKTNFINQINNAVNGTAFTADMIISIALQESAIDWIGWIDKHTPDEILSICISDPTGDQPDTVRNVWPQNAAAFREKYPDLIEMLIAEGNNFRAMKGWSARPWLYKAYGIFQYDIQAIDWDKDFFAKRQWYSMDECLKRLMTELNEKYRLTGGDVWKSIERYNGAGAAAVAYMGNVKQFNSWIA